LIEGYNHANGVNFLALLTAISVLRDGLVATGNLATPRADRYRAATTPLPSLPALSELPVRMPEPIRVRIRQTAGRLIPKGALEPSASRAKSNPGNRR